MNRISIFVLLVLIFLGLSKSFSPSEKRAPFVENEKVLSALFPGSPLSIILLDSFQTGFLIKTYYQRYKIVHGFKAPETITVRTTRGYWNQVRPYLGMGLFRRSEREKEEETTPLPPGALYIGDPAYGYWDYRHSGEKIWVFHRAYRHFPAMFSWGDFTPTFQFYEEMLIHEKNNRPFVGLKNEFGIDGVITKKYLPVMSKVDNGPELTIQDHLYRYFQIPNWRNK